MIGIIDLGSNTVRMSIYELRNDRLIPRYTTKETVGLAAHIDERNQLTDEGISSAIRVIQAFQKEAVRFRLRKLYLIATASLRNIENSSVAIQAIEQSTQLEVDLLSGEDEALCDYYGVKQTYDLDDGFVVDIGGGSTELVEVGLSEVKQAFAIPFGSLNTYMKFVKRILPKDREQEKMRSEILEELTKKSVVFGKHRLMIGVGGSMRAIRKLLRGFPKGDPQNDRIQIEEISQWLKRIQDKDKEAILDVIRLVPERVHTIVPGMTILTSVADYLGATELMVVEYGVREGYLYRKVILPTLRDSHDDTV